MGRCEGNRLVCSTQTSRVFVEIIYYKMNGGRRPTRDKGRQTRNQNKPRRGKHPHLSRRGTIQITMNNIIHISTGRNGLRRRGNEIIMERFP